MAWLIVLAVLLVIFLAPLGVDFAWSRGGLALSAKVGVIAIKILPRKMKEKHEKPKTPKQIAKAERKKAKKDAKKAKKAAEKQYRKEHPEEFPPKKPDYALFLHLGKLALRALDRFRIKLSFDLVRFHYTAGGDPYETAIMYGKLSSLLLNLPHLVEKVLNVRRWDLDAGCDFTAEKPLVDCRFIITIQLWEILYVALAFGFEFLTYILKSRREKRRAERKLRNAEPIG